MIIMIITVKMKMMRIVLFQKENQKIVEYEPSSPTEDE